MLTILTRAAVASLMLGSAAVAQTATAPATPATPAPVAPAPAAPAPAMDHSSHAMPAAAPAAGAMAVPDDATPSTRAYIEALTTMHDGMTIDYTGDADVDFVRGMIPHHQGAVAMARIELEHGKDPELRKLAEEIIKAQDTEIAFMQDWLKKNAK